ncbi:MAG: AI-2E family transporter [Clostridia bacterium]|nr:AI-2E family transporter [Clostridia bacterium]
MRLNWNRKYTTIAIYCAIVLVFVALVIFLLVSAGNIGTFFKNILAAFRPLVYGIVLAYLMWPTLRFFERRVFAFITGDDAVPRQPELPDIPDVPKKPKEPKKPVFKEGGSIEKYRKECADYEQAHAEYKRALREYKRALFRKKLVERRRASIIKNAPRLEKRIARVTARHERIFARSYEDGAKRTRFGVRRALSALSAIIVALILLALFMYMIVPQLADGFTELSTKMPVYIASFTTWLSDVAKRSDYLGDIVKGLIEYLNTFLSTIYNFLQGLLPTIASAVSSLLSILKDIGLGIFFSIYFLLGKERVIAKCKKLSCALLTPRAYVRFSKIGRDLNKNFGSFITAKLMDCLIIGLISLLVLLFLGVPYYPLLAAIIGVTNFIPIFGPFVGGFIGGFIVLITDPSKLLAFIIYVIIVQQFDGNILGPRLLGAQTNMTSLGILTALTIMSSYWGFAGLVVAVPLSAVIYSLIKELSERKLKKRGQPTETSDFYDPDDHIGRALHEESQLKKDHKKTLRQALSSSKTGDRALKLKIVSTLVDKVDEADEQHKNSDFFGTRDDSAEEFLKDIKINPPDLSYPMTETGSFDMNDTGSFDTAETEPINVPDEETDVQQTPDENQQ